MNTVAQTILEQLGGKRMMLMTGARVETYSDVSIRLRLSLGKLTKFEVIYNPGTDTYNVHCIKGSGVNCRLAKDPIREVFADELVRVFERETGLYASL